MNTGEPWPGLDEALPRVLRMQAKLHLWAARDAGRRFDDLYNLVCDPAFLVVAWDRVRKNKGARTAGVDGVSPRSIVAGGDVAGFLADTRAQLKARVFSPLPVRERLIPKGSPGKFRSLGIPSAMDRLVQASVKLVLEPIFEADFKPVSYGFRPRRRAQDAIAEIHHFGTQGYHWVLEADIEACFDEISHPELVRRIRARIGDKRHGDLLAGSYDCVDRVVLNAFFPIGHNPGGFRSWWRRLHGGDDQLDDTHLMGWRAGSPAGSRPGRPRTGSR